MTTGKAAEQAAAATGDAAEQSTEGAVRAFEDRPQSEVAQELETDSYGVDLHDDPEFQEAIPESDAEFSRAVAQWRVAKSLLKLRAQVNAKAPNRNKASDGAIGDTRHCGRPNSTSDHCPRIRDGGVGVVAAMDITHDPTHGCDAGALARSVHASRDPRVKYIIWNRRIANSSPIGSSPAWTWRSYNGSNPHSHHVHISVKRTKTEYDSEAAWRLPGADV